MEQALTHLGGPARFVSRKRTLSPSALGMLWKCGEMYRRRYIEGEKIPPGVALIVGRATHKTVETNLQNKIETGQLLAEAEIKDMARDETHHMWDSEEVKLEDDEKEKGADAVKAESIDTSVALSSLHRMEVAPVIEPIHVERRFRLEMDGYPFDLTGVVDIQAKENGEIIVRDTKTASKSPSATAAHLSEQLTFYSLGVEIVDGKLPEKVYLDHLVKTKIPKTVILESSRNEADIETLLARIERGMEIIEREAFTPADPSSWICSARFCGFWATCKFAKRPKSIQVL